MGVAPVAAQTASESTTGATQPDAQLAIAYRDILAEYREAERASQIAQQDMVQLRTLAAIEQAVVTTRETAQLRASVLYLYIQQVRVALTQVPAVDTELRTQIIDQLLSLEAELLAHQQRLAAIETRAELSAELAQFALFSKQIQVEVEFAKTITQLGKLQTSQDQLKQLLELLVNIDQTQLTNDEVLPYQRAMLEIENKLQQSGSLLQSELTDVLNLRARSSTTRIALDRRESGAIYGTQTQALAFFQELIR